MKYCTLQCLLVVVFLCFFLTNAVSLVPAMCKKISQDDPKNVGYEFCVSLLRQHPGISKATAPQLAVITFQLGVSKAKNISSNIEELLNGLKSDPLPRAALKDCSELYSEVPDDLEAGLTALKAGDFAAADIKVSAVMNAATTCGDGINNDNNKGISGLAKENSDFYQLGAISLGFIKLMGIVN